MKMNHYLNVPGLLRRFAKIGLALLLVLPVAFGAGAQDVSPARVSGTVVDQQGMPVVGAGVVVRGTQTGSVTDLDGRFTVMAAKDATLTVSFIGYTTREVPVGTQTDIRIVLEENVQSIDDVVVVGFGTQKKETVTGAIGQLSGKELMRLGTASRPAAESGKKRRLQRLAHIQPHSGTFLFFKYSGSAGRRAF